MKKFLFALFLFLSPLALLIPLWNFYLKKSEWDNFGLLNFQVTKLKKSKGKHFNRLYIGDSSGGNALSTQNDSNALNLCLSGSFGFEGQIEFIDIIDNYITYDTVIVMNTIDMCTRPYNEDAIWITNLHSTSPYKFIRGLIVSHKFCSDLLQFSIENLNSKVNFHFIDYPISYIKTNEIKNNKFNKKFYIKKLQVLRELNIKLDQKHIPYFILFGPSLPYDSVYFESLKSQLKINNISHCFNDPFLLDEITKGSTEDHIHPNYRDLSTKYYLDIIRK